MDFIIPTACRRESAGKTGSTKASKDTGHWPVLPDKRCRSRSTISRCITFVTQFGHYEQKLSTLQSPTLTYSEERGRYGDVKRIPLSLSLPVWSAYALHCAVLTSTGPGFAASSSVYTSLIPPALLDLPRSILDCLGNMDCRNLFDTGQIGNSAGQAEDTMIAAR